MGIERIENSEESPAMRERESHLQDCRSLKLSNLNINRNRGVNREIISLLHSQN